MTEEDMSTEFYEKFCKDRFDHIDDRLGSMTDHFSDQLDNIKEILVGNGRTPGLADDVRDLQSFKKIVIGILSLIAVTVFTQMAIWVRGLMVVMPKWW